MSWNVSLGEAPDESSAFKLSWDDRTEFVEMYPAGVKQVWDETGYVETQYPAYVQPYTLYGLNKKYDNIDQYRAAFNRPNVIVGSDGYLIEATTSNIFAGVTQNLEGISGGTRIITSKEVEGFKVTLALPGLFWIDDKQGYMAMDVSVSIFYRAYNPLNPAGSGPWSVLHSNYIISGKQRAEILKTISTGDLRLPLSKYEILVVRNSEDHTGHMKITDDVYVKEITEIIFGEIAYNHTALLGLKIRATDQLSGQVPTVTSLVKGIKVQVPSNLVAAYGTRYDAATGSYDPTGDIAAAYANEWLDGQLGETRVWTDNPVWCLYDLLTNTRYGLGNYYKISSNKRGLMLANFYLMAQYCDDPIEYLDESVNPPVTKKRPRFSLNIVIDQSKTAAEWVGQIAAIMRAVVYYSEGIFWIDIDRKKYVTQLFTMSNISEYTQTGTSFRSIPNSYEVQWINPATNYEIDSFKLDAKELQDDATLEERKKALQLIGVTNFDQAKALAKYALLSGQHKDKIVTFKTGTDGLRCAVSDVIGIQHDVPKWGYGGVIASYDDLTGVATFDTPLTLDAGEDAEYFMKLDLLTGAEVLDIPLGNLGNTELSSVNIGAGLALDEALTYRFLTGVTTNVVATFKVVAIKRDSDEKVEITAALHDDQIFDYCDSTAGLSTYTTQDYTLLINPRRISVQGMYASNKIYRTNAGAWATGVEVFYDVPQSSSFWSAAQLHYAPVGSGNYTTVGIDTTGYFFIPDVPAGDYQFVVTSIYTTGKQTISDAISDHSAHPWTTLRVESFNPDEAFLTGVTGLSIENKANDGTFLGRDCIIVWRRPQVVATSTSAGSETAGAATDNTAAWLSHYEVKVLTLDGATKRVSNVYAERFVYSYEMNYQDATDGDADRKFVVSVACVDKLGRKSVPVKLECLNPAPAVIS